MFILKQQSCSGLYFSFLEQRAYSLHLNSRCKLCYCNLRSLFSPGNKGFSFYKNRVAGKIKTTKSTRNNGRSINV